ncbi:MAG: RNA 2',3'-cyclic phosphodiesterase [Fimbriiglobus sp.]
MPRTRVFLAVAVGDPTRDAVFVLQRALGRVAPGTKWVTRENLHVTLLFLGEVDDRELHAVSRAVQKAVAAEPPFVLRVSGVGAFPNPRRPKTVWGGITDGATELTRLHSLLEPPLIELGANRREERAFTPHLTLGRVNSDADGAALAAEMPKHLAWNGGYADATEVLVMASDMRRDGPEYSVMARAPLGGTTA